MWPTYLRNIFIICIPFSLVVYGALFRRDASNEKKVKRGKRIQVVAIADAAFLILGDYLAVGYDNMLTFYIGLGLSLVTTIIYFSVLYIKRDSL